MQHLKKKKQNPVFTCDLCGFADSRSNFFKLHISRHRSKIECKICNKTFFNVEKHLKTHEKENSEIDVENLESRSSSQLEVPQIIENRVLRRWIFNLKNIFTIYFNWVFVFSLKICPSTADCTDKEIESSDDEVPKKRKKRRLKHANPQPCKICHMILQTKETMAKHMENIHAKEQPMFCDYCQKRFVDKTTLRLHMQYHRTKRFTCNICYYKCAMIYDLMRHKRIHNFSERKVQNLRQGRDVIKKASAVSSQTKKGLSYLRDKYRA